MFFSLLVPKTNNDSALAVIYYSLKSLQLTHSTLMFCVFHEAEGDVKERSRGSNRQPKSTHTLKENLCTIKLNFPKKKSTLKHVAKRFDSLRNQRHREQWKFNFNLWRGLAPKLWSRPNRRLLGVEMRKFIDENIIWLIENFFVFSVDSAYEFDGSNLTG